MDLTSFHQNLPIKIKEVIQTIAKIDFKVGLIGGIPRDYILNNEIGTDFDCEVRPLSGEIADWEKLKSKILNSYEVEELNYNVLRIKFPNSSIEITLPRIEHFDGTKGHSNFEAEFIADLDYTQGFARRDLTVNAVMFEYDSKQWKMIDPLNGAEDIENKVLISCSTSFAMDPVRFLRAIRFKTNLFFNISEELLEVLEQMDLSSITSYYLKLELSKCSRPLVMLKRIMEIRNEFIEELTIRSDNKTLIQYDKFYDGNLETHIRQAVVLPVQSRILILEKLGFSSKNILPNIKFDESWKSLIEEDFDSEKFKQFHSTLTKLEILDIHPEKLFYLLEYYAFDIDTQNFDELKSQKYELTDKDKEEKKEHYKFIIFYKRVKALCDKF